MPNNINKELVFRKRKLCLLANIILDSQTTLSHNIELLNFDTEGFVENFKYVLQLQIFEFPVITKYQVQLPSNTTKKLKQLWIRAY